MSDKKPSTEKSGEKPAETEKEIGGYENKLEPTRYGDWESNGRVTDF